MKVILRSLIFLLFVNLSLINFSEAQNKRDEKGRKQGMHIESDRFERKIFNYRNDTLHGFYAKYRHDTIFQTGFYKNGFKDSIWSYYENGIITESSYVKKGERQGEQTFFHPNGSINTVYIVMNNEIHGDYKCFYADGKLRCLAKYDNGSLIGQKICFSPKGDTILPRFIPQAIIKNDTSIINHTKLKIYKLFETYSSLDSCVENDYTLFNEVIVYKQKTPIISVDPLNITILAKGVKVSIENTPKGLKKINYGFTYKEQRISKTSKNTCEKLRYTITDPQPFLGISKIDLYLKERRCADTDNCPMEIFSNGKSLLFKDIGNLIFFEFDADKNGQKELYIVDYYTCENRLVVYKVDDK